MARRKLTQRQQARIKAIQVKRRRQLDECAVDAPDSSRSEACREGRVITRHGQNLAVAGTDGNLYHCLLRQSIGEPVCGDRVVWQPTAADQGVVTALLERSSLLTRPTYGGAEKALAANIDLLVVVLAPEPAPSQYLLDQYLIAAENLGLDAAITCNKWDLTGPQVAAEFERNFGHYEAIGYPLVRVSAKTDHGLDPLIVRLQRGTSILVGQSGVGKSSLVKALIPDIDIQTGRLSKTSGMGRHTTSATTLYRMPQGGELIDSPGVRSFRLGRMNARQLESGFREFRPFIGHCRFANCSHNHEPGCALIGAVAAGRIHPRRLENFRHMAAGLTSDY
ncbi:MAG: ribosome small subunit-dependent GTPase A [Gammaproteobacteria bacterium]|nr:ribosome small subunit-dependent GTPase A [Gammaproteobacteria bacterium]